MSGALAWFGLVLTGAVTSVGLSCRRSGAGWVVRGPGRGPEGCLSPVLARVCVDPNADPCSDSPGAGGCSPWAQRRVRRSAPGRKTPSHPGPRGGTASVVRRPVLRLVPELARGEDGVLVQALAESSV